MQNKIKQCQNCKFDFNIEPGDFNFYEKMKVPPPTKCPSCRQQQRILFRNFKTLYRRPSSKSGKMIVSMYSPSAPFPVYDIAEWWNDDWDPMAYGIDMDWNRPFFAQYDKLVSRVPHMSMMNIKSENCGYSNMVYASKNCYLLFGSVENENCDYGHIVWNSRDCVDNLYVFKSEACYECIDCLNCNRVAYSQECEACADSIGLFDCKGCISCTGCIGLINKSYCLFNEEIGKEKYEAYMRENPIWKKGTLQKILDGMENLRRSLPQRAFFGYRNNKVSGNHIYNARNVLYSFDIKSGENSKFCYTIRKAVDTYDVSFSPDVSECYQALTLANVNKIVGSEQITDSHDVYYSSNCFNCDNIFGCYGLSKKSYCVLNKQYSKEEYETLQLKLKEHMARLGEWGEFFPHTLSPFCYNESIANEYRPLKKEEALKQGYRWQENIPSTTGKETISFENLPINPKDYTDDLQSEIFACEDCGKNYHLISREIGIYKRLGIIIPHKCFNCRHKTRMAKRNRRRLWPAECAKCGADIQTSYDPERQKIYKLYCESCYNKEVY